MKRRLIVLCGLPGVGKTTLSRTLAREINAVHLRVDTIEQALLRSALQPDDIMDASYQAAYSIATDILKQGQSVIADAVNPVEKTRDAWKQVAESAGASLAMIEISCSDHSEHKLRVENRLPDIEGHILPTWQAVIERAYEPWRDEQIRLDTAGKTIEDSLNQLLNLLSR